MTKIWVQTCYLKNSVCIVVLVCQLWHKVNVILRLLPLILYQENRIVGLDHFALRLSVCCFKIYWCVFKGNRSLFPLHPHFIKQKYPSLNGPGEIISGLNVERFSKNSKWKIVSYLVGWCFEHSQPRKKIISRVQTNVNPSLFIPRNSHETAKFFKHHKI